MSSPPSTADTRTARHRFLDYLLLGSTGGNLRQFVLDRPAVPWRLIVTEVVNVTGEDVTEAAIAGWFRDDVEVQSARAAARDAAKAAS